MSAYTYTEEQNLCIARLYASPHNPPFPTHAQTTPTT